MIPSSPGHSFTPSQSLGFDNTTITTGSPYTAGGARPKSFPKPGEEIIELISEDEETDTVRYEVVKVKVEKIEQEDPLLVTKDVEKPSTSKGVPPAGELITKDETVPVGELLSNIDELLDLGTPADAEKQGDVPELREEQMETDAVSIELTKSEDELAKLLGPEVD
jgi:hypothetical protein